MDQFTPREIIMRAIPKHAILLVLSMLLVPVTPVLAQVSVAIGGPGISIGINVPVYPRLVPVPGYSVYYAPAINANYFFYDGLYWVYTNDNWYESSWYNGPWEIVSPDAVPVVILRVPVRYYRRPPWYFHGWAMNAPPRWSEHWGQAWANSHPDWDHRSHTAQPTRAPLPSYQRQYSGNRYPHPAQQQQLATQHYHYQPHDKAVRPYYHAHQPERGGPPGHAQATRNDGKSNQQQGDRQHGDESHR